jgi:hypothetical protein
MNLEVNIDLCVCVCVNNLKSWNENRCDIKRGINRAANSCVLFRN